MCHLFVLILLALSVCLWIKFETGQSFISYAKGPVYQKYLSVRENHSRIRYKIQLVLKILLYQTANIKTSSILITKKAPFFRKSPEVTLHSSRVGRIMGRICGNPMTAGQEYISYKRKTVRAYHPSDTLSFKTLPILLKLARGSQELLLTQTFRRSKPAHHPRQGWLIFIIILIKVLLLLFILHEGRRSFHPGAADVRSVWARRGAFAKRSEINVL